MTIRRTPPSSIWFACKCGAPCEYSIRRGPDKRGMVTRGQGKCSHCLIKELQRRAHVRSLPSHPAVHADRRAVQRLLSEI